MKRVLFLLSAVLLINSCNSDTSWSVKSPDGTVAVRLELTDAGSLTYSADYLADAGTVAAIEPSALGLMGEKESFTTGLTFIGSSGVALNEDSYTLITGKKLDIETDWNETVVSFENENGVRIDIEIRVFDDGFGFRYSFPGAHDEPLVVLSDLTEFNLPDEGNCWSQPYDTVTKWAPAYETLYVRKMEIGTTAPANKNGWSFPLTAETSGLWMLITESNLDGNYFASHLQADCADGIYKIRLPEAEESYGRFPNSARMTTPGATPWRVVIIGESPASIIESSLVTDLADPSKIEDTSWIKPGRAAWSWWSDSPSPQYVSEQNRFTDLAVEMGWEYNLIDANWDEMKDGVVTDAVDYATSKGSGAILWYNSGGNHNTVEEAPRDKMWDAEVRAEEFKKIAGWGVKGVKVDFFQSDKQAVINQYIGILEDAADNEVMVNFHGCTLPRGWRRTWPNMVTLESVRGAEVYKFGKDYPENAPWHNTVLCFTRNAVGPMDYTPVTFSDHTYPHLTTYAHELALSVLFESGIIHMADKVEEYLSLPETARDFLSEVPSVWDDTKFVNGYPGESVILARKSGDAWYVAGINGMDTPQELILDLDFLEDAQERTLSLIADGADDSSFRFEEMQVEGDGSVSIKTLPFGGFACVIK